LNNANGDDWYNLHVILIGCYWGWCKLAIELYNRPDTDRTSYFYNTWILPSIDLSSGYADYTSSAKKLSQFLDANAEFMTSGVSRLQARDLFRTAVRLETAFFDSGFQEALPRPGPAQ